MPGLRIYVDGGSTGNPGPGGWAAVLLMGDEFKEISGGEADTTNNRMELTAVIRALRVAARIQPDMEIYTDSQYVQKGITEWMNKWVENGWKTSGGKPVKNKDLWLELKELSAGCDIRWKWVKGHAGNRWNERCDKLVGMERKRFA